MKNFVKFAFIVFSLCANAAANEQQFKPLEDILKQEKSPVMLVYAYERCSGLFGAVYGEFNSSTSNKAKDVAAQALTRSVNALMAAVELGEIHKLDVSVNNAQIQSVEFMKMYEKQMKAHWQKTGNMFSKSFLADQDVCQTILAKKQTVFSSLIEVVPPSNVWLNVRGFQNSEFIEPLPSTCIMKSIMLTEEGPSVFLNLALIIDQDSVGVVLGAILKKQSGEILPLRGFSRNTSIKLADWEHDPQNNVFLLTGRKALDFMIEYMGKSIEVERDIQRNTFDPTKHFIFLEFQNKKSDIYHAPLFFGIYEPIVAEFSDCLSKWAQIARNPQ